ncbi:MAG: hypothetical protein B6229_04795 [Spirochaetaceae bacterium 4572_7]|nr:MAG: hypothetical protein B6229_04795 [Spirochaetaceae bacterium 4572_7]
MITLRKLQSLKENSRFRKYIIILQDIENNILNQKSLNINYIKSILKSIILEDGLPLRTKEIASQINDIEIRSINSLRHSILTHLSIEPSEWDFRSPLDGGNLSSNKFGINLFLDDLRSPFNLGSIFRTCECFGVSNIYLSKDTTQPTHKRAIRTAMGCIDRVSWENKELIDIEGPIFALELGGTDIDSFQFPITGTVIIGNEELGISPEALKIADNSLGRVSIPLSGTKSSLNVSNATSILLQRWNEHLRKNIS